MNLVLLGPPGAGKGTQAELLARSRNLVHVSTGDLFREAVEAKSELGILAKASLDRGELVEDGIVIRLIRETLPQAGGFLLDGFPRTLAQAQALDQMLEEEGKEIDRVINLSVDEEGVTQRLLGRGRPDDSREVIQKRLTVYRTQTEPLVAYYRNKGTLRSINGLRTIEEVRDAIEAELKELA